MWWLNAAIAVPAVALAVLVVLPAPALAGPHLPWWLLALAVAVCERWPVDLRFQRSRHSFSLTDIPLTLGLVFATGPDLLAGLMVGTTAALLGRRLPPIKFAFNLGQFALAGALGVLVLQAVAGPEAAFGPRVWLGALLGTQAGGLVTIALLAAAISLADGRLSRAEVRAMFGMDLVVTVANTCFALVAAMLLIAFPAGLSVLLVPVLMAYAGYRAYVREHERHRKVEFLYQANRSLAESPELAGAVAGLLERARETFRVERAEVVLLGAGDAPPLRSSLGLDGAAERLTPIDPRDARALHDLAADGPVALAGPLPAAAAALAGGTPARNALVAVLHGPKRVLGTIALSDRVGLARRFGDDDLALFGALAANASSALQFDRLEQAVTELQELQEQLRHQAAHDPLTGLANRARLAQETARRIAEGRSVAVLFCDLDDFKGVNDALGHATGDELLCAAAARIRGAVGADDLVARHGGDEFAVLASVAPDAVDALAAATAERLVAAFLPPVAVEGRALHVRLSVGLATTGQSGPGAEDLLRDAEVAMYQAKAAGKGRFETFTTGMREAVVRRHELRDELAAAIEDGQLRLQYQPIVDLRDGRMTAVEALVRWEHPERGRVPPLEFVPLAEETGLIVPLGRWVLREACSRAAAWTAARAGASAGREPISIQVNLSARELEDPDLIEGVAATLAKTGLPPEQLTLEITETVLVRDAEAGGATLAGLRALGVHLALDDFGTGYSSLSYLRALPLTSLKVAREFVDGIARDSDDAAFVRLIVELARLRGLRVVAEGIETAEQLAVLRDFGCDRGQGYHFSRPRDPEDRFLLTALGLTARPSGARAGAAPARPAA